jgi:hypothetical protein
MGILIGCIVTHLSYLEKILLEEHHNVRSYYLIDSAKADRRAITFTKKSGLIRLRTQYIRFNHKHAFRSGQIRFTKRTLVRYGSAQLDLFNALQVWTKLASFDSAKIIDSFYRRLVY